MNKDTQNHLLSYTVELRFYIPLDTK